jgi:hypothetical protein
VLTTVRCVDRSFDSAATTVSAAVGSTARNVAANARHESSQCCVATQLNQQALISRRARVVRRDEICRRTAIRAARVINRSMGWKIDVSRAIFEFCFVFFSFR